MEAACTGHPKGQGESAQPTNTLLRRPKVFSLALVWESPQVRHATSGYTADNTRVVKQLLRNVRQLMRCVLCRTDCLAHVC